MIPPPSRFGHIKSRAESRVAQLLSEVDIGEAATCFYSVHLSRHEYKRMSEIDFLIVADGVLLILEVKGGRVARRDGVWTFTDRYGNVNEKREGPFEQARSAAFALGELLEERAPSLRTDFGSVVVTPDQVLGTDLEWDAAECIGPNQMSISSFEAALKRALRYWRTKCKHNSHTSFKEVTALVRPDFDRVPSLSSQSGLLEQDYIRLASEQYAALRGAETNSRVFVTGGAGSGKTILAVETAKRAAEEGRRVLLTCRSPAVTNVMRDATVESGVVCLPYSKTSGLGTFDVLVVDEAQDLMTVDDLVHLDGLVEGGIQHGRWRMFSDPNNQLNIDGDYDAEVASELRGHSAQYELPYNCRNTVQVVHQTQLITGADIGVAKAGEGPRVGFDQYDSVEDAAGSIDREIEKLRKQETPLGDIAIVTLRENPSDSAATLTRAYRRGQIATYGELNRTAGQAISLLNARTIKGLEAPHVLVTDVDDLSSRDQVARLYVGMTRPRISLWLCVSRLAWTQMQSKHANGEK
jgi:hypothetical protein